MEKRFEITPEYAKDELARVNQTINHYQEMYEKSPIKNIMLHRLIAIKEQERKLLEFINRAYNR